MYKKLLFAIMFFSTAQAVTILNLGNTYDFAEENLLDLLSKRIEEKQIYLNANKESITNELKNKVDNYKPKNLAKLTPAPKTTSRLVDITYILENDIVAYNKVYYRKGYKINPLQYVALPKKYIIFNGDNVKELDYVKKHYKGKLDYEFILCGGDYKKSSEILGVWLYYLPQVMKDRFKLEHSISIVSQENNLIKIDEISVD
ncbi:hypothetical protein [Campylobacter sp. MG1]|uniref:hypothetical protein n=1 Tax=Campylobacter sp. MG1 TaxID=2976332 RepID=UPI00226CE52A|nr:hypothetical protein [Campylobacter sp. MG1]